jgi:hypothetical protein
MPKGNPGTHQRAKRDVIKGWSASTTRRLTKWLYSIQADQLTGHGYAVTLTMRHTPPDRDALDRVFRALMARYDRMGVTRLHWVMEMQRRGTPHYHLIIYTAEELPLRGLEFVRHWLEVADEFGPAPVAQRAEPLENASGWFQYLSKHASRSAAHYQRQGMPPGWEKTGRLWGKRGDWPTADGPMKFDMDREAWFRFRRLVRSWRIANARQEKIGGVRARRIRSARRMLATHDRKLAEVRGTSEWMPEATQLALLGFLADQGYAIVQVDEIAAEEPTDSPLVRRLQRELYESMADAA